MAKVKYGLFQAKNKKWYIVKKQGKKVVLGSNRRGYAGFKTKKHAKKVLNRSIGRF